MNLVCLQSAFGVGTKKSVEMYQYIKNKGLIETSLFKLKKKDFLYEEDFNFINSIDKNRIRKIFNDCEKDSISILTIEDSKYPSLLRNISTPPLVLYIKGELPQFNKIPAVCIVGPRKHSQFGGKSAYSLARRLSMAGILVVSGAAMGCDSFAHQGALDYECKTVAVLAHGIGYDYLPKNRILRAKISQNGCLMSEYPPYTPTTKYSFLVRNRIMSGLCLATVVVEAPEISGALSTANHAAEQGREVFVIPGNPTDKHYIGSNKLLQDGANVLTSALDILNLYAVQYPDAVDIEKAYAKKAESQKNNKKIQKKSISGLSNEAKIVYNYLDKQKFFADELLKLGLSDDMLLSALTELELLGLIKAVPGGAFETL